MGWLSRIPAKRLEAPPRGGRGECAVTAILTLEKEVLLVKRSVRPGDQWSGQWALPGGFWREGDVDLLATALREVREEVGFDAENLRLLGWLTPRRPLIRPEIRVYPLVFLADRRMDVRLSDELEGYRWAPLTGLVRVVRTVEAYSGLREAESYVWEDVLVWGLTYSILRELRGE